MQKWIIEFEVDDSWVVDGFNLTAERAKSMLANEIGGAYNHEIDARIVSAPDAAVIAELQGYASVEAMQAAN